VQSPEVLQAALLHDVGKTAVAASLWMRVLMVLLERLVPGWLERVGQEGGDGWRRHVLAYQRHAEIGAELAAQAGSSPLTVSLIRRHHHQPGPSSKDHLLAMLQEADASH
jgi:hypothetical protein